jgi:hypothetical protein
MDQNFIIWIIGAVNLLGGFLLNALWQSVKDLQTTDSKIVEKVASIEKVVAGEYMRREEFTAMMETLFKKLDRIEDKVERKADR